MDGDPKGKHDQSGIENDDTWSKEKLEKDQTGNDKLIEILEKAVENLPPVPQKKEGE